MSGNKTKDVIKRILYEIRAHALDSQKSLNNTMRSIDFYLEALEGDEDDEDNN